MKNKGNFLFLFFVSAIAYLPFITQFGYIKDDWYLMYSANILSGDVFHEIFSIDRPMRGILLDFLYSIFGLNPIYYNLSGYFFRLTGGLAFLVTLQTLWPRQKYTNLIASSLYLIFPGFLSSPNAIDYQAHQVALFLAHFTIALSVKVINMQKLHRIFFGIISAPMIFAYLGLVEHFIGLEVFRILCIFLVANRNFETSLVEKLRRFFSYWIPFSIGILAFAIWRFLFFSSERKATDFGFQINQFFESPLLFGINWTEILFRDVFEVVVLSWVVPLVNLWNVTLRIREMLLVVGISAVCVLVVTLMLNQYKLNEKELVIETSSWRNEAFWIGIVCAIAGFIPVVFSNRDADFGNLSRYMLASSVGAAILVTVFVGQFQSKATAVSFVSMVIVCSVLTHYFNGLYWAKSSQGMKDFWWQVSWRIPQIKENTTLVVNYSHVSVEEDYLIWGPANFLYYPENTSQKNEPKLWGLVLNRANTISILKHAEPVALNRRSVITYLGYDNILVLTQPSPLSCLQVLDGNIPIVSEYEQYDIQAIAKESNQSNIILDEPTPPLLPLAVVFGHEPEHTWCYFYQKATLAFQEGDYTTVLALKQQAKQLNFFAQDPVEWMPFLQAAILLENYEEATELLRYVKKNPWLYFQTCTALPNLNAEMGSFIQRSLCSE